MPYPLSRYSICVQSVEFPAGGSRECTLSRCLEKKVGQDPTQPLSVR